MLIALFIRYENLQMRCECRKCIISDFFSRCVTLIRDLNDVTQVLLCHTC